MGIPLLWPAIPPLLDLPGHLARYHVAIDGGRTASLAAAFAYHWRLIGNLGVDLAVMPLAPLLGVERAAKLVVWSIPVLTAGGMLAVARVVHGRVPPTALFALPLALAWPFQQGFVNFCLAMALAFWVLAGWIALVKRPLLRAALAVPASWIVWTAHSFGWGLLGLMAFAAEAALQRRTQSAHVAAIRAAFSCLALATPLSAMIGTSATGAENSGFFSLPGKIAGIASVLRDHWMILDLASALILFAILYLAARDRRLGFDAVIGWPALLLAATFMATPHMLFGGAFADTRILPFAVALAMLAIRPTKDQRFTGALAGAGLGFFAIRVIAATASLAMNAADIDRELAVLPAIPRGASIFAAVRRDCEGSWDRRRIDHVPSIAILRRDAFTNDQWIMTGQQLLTIRDTGAAPFDHDPSQIVSDRDCGLGTLDLDTTIARLPRRRYTYLWTIGFPPGRVRDHSFTPVWSSAGSAFYRIERSTLR